MIFVSCMLAGCASVPHAACELVRSDYELLSDPPNRGPETLKQLGVAAYPVDSRDGYTEAWFTDSNAELAVCAFAKSGCGYHSVVVFIDECRLEDSECVRESICQS